MDTSFLHFSLLFCLLSAAITTNAFLLSDNDDALLDASGSPVRSGVEYYIVPASSRGGGGVKPTTLSTTSSCPAYVGHESYEADYGTSVTLQSVNNPNSAAIDASEKVVIQFSTVERCIWSPTVWTVEESSRGKLLVTGGDPPKFPPPVGIGNNMFAFRRREGSRPSYTLHYCRCNLCEQSCDPVGKASVNGQTILSVVESGEASEGLPVVLVKVGEESQHLSSLVGDSFSDE